MPRHIINRSEFGLLFTKTPEQAKGYLHITAICNNIVSQHHSLVITQEIFPPLVTTGQNLINLAIPYSGCVKLGRSPHLVFIRTSARVYGRVPRALKSLAVIDTYMDYVRTFGLRHIRFLSISGMSCHLNIKPTACLEVLSMPDAHGPMHSTSGSYRLLVAYDLHVIRPTVSYVRKNRKPIVTIISFDSITRHEPNIVRIPNMRALQDGYLIREKATALIVPPIVGLGRRADIMEFRYIVCRDLLSNNPMPGIFCPK